MGGILVVGASGLIGSALARAWRGRGARVVAASREPEPGPDGRRLDLAEPAAARALLRELRPELVALPAANPHVDYCESHPEQTRRVNVAGTLELAAAAAELGAPLVFFSSDYVFDGARGAYREEDPVCPLNEYGRQKAEAEAGVRGLSQRNLVVRTAAAYGWQRRPQNFVLQVIARLSAGEAIRVPDLLCNPTYADNLAEAVVELCARKLGGIFHVVGAERLPRLEFARLAARTFGLDESKILPMEPGACSARAPRPRDSSLLTAKVRAATGVRLLGAAEGLSAMKQKGEVPA
ncbi:MAG: SDR family oxidoreductase [Elusimicrobia bacterium]|nr:SDR family oxidoreductase [Elusimicrobiota bacterium]